MNSYINHPSDIPIEYHYEEALDSEYGYLGQLGYGGLSFHSESPLAEGSLIKLRIPAVNPTFEATGRVIRCREEPPACFVIRVDFLKEEDSFRIRMVEQACHIQHYRKEMFEKEGRRLSGNEAALEWIGKYANRFPAPPTR